MHGEALAVVVFMILMVVDEGNLSLVDDFGLGPRSGYA